MQTAISTWDKNKVKEKGFKSVKEEMQAIPIQFPALMRAEKVMKKARKAGLKLAPTELAGIVLSLSKKLTTIVQEKSIQESEFGELMLSLCSLAYALEIDAEPNLKKATSNFIESFEI